MITNPSHSVTRMLAFARECARKALLLAGLGLLAQAALAQTNIVGNGGFESPSVVHAPTFDTWGPGSALAPWVIAGDSIDLIKGYWQPAEGSQSLDLDGNGPGSISQVLSTEAGRTYKLRFKYAANPDRWSDGSRRNDCRR